jgi:hypothetical protein
MSNGGGAGGSAQLWQLLVAIAPAIVPTVMAAALEIWRVRRAEAAEKLARQRRKRKLVYDDETEYDEGENDGSV